MHRLGPTLILLFGLSQAARDVYLGSMFQGVGIFSVIALAFTISTLVFGTLAAVRRRADFAVLRSHWRTTLAMVVTTAPSRASPEAAAVPWLGWFTWPPTSIPGCGGDA